MCKEIDFPQFAFDNVRFDTWQLDAVERHEELLLHVERLTPEEVGEPQLDWCMELGAATTSWMRREGPFPNLDL